MSTSRVIFAEDQVARVRKQYGVITHQSIDDVSVRERLFELVYFKDTPANYLEQFLQTIRTYAQENLNQINALDHYTTMEVNVGFTAETSKPKSATKAERMQAVNLLLDIVKKASAQEVYDYVNTPKLKALIGIHEYKFNPFRLHLSRLVAEFNAAFEKHQQRSSSSALASLLLDESIAVEIDSEQLSILFWYYDAKLIADVIVHCYQYESVSLKGLDAAGDIQLQNLKDLLAGTGEMLDRVNRFRASKKLPQLLPVDRRMPGRNQLVDEGLSAHELFQYDENAVFAVEHCLRETFKPLLANKIIEQGTLAAKNPLAPYYFYFISAGAYMLIDPDDKKNPYYDRYALFKEHIREWVSSYDVGTNKIRAFYGLRTNKSIIFCGIINMDGSHYVPYFIYKNNDGLIQVVTVDPSPKVSSNEEDNKSKTARKLQRIFQDIFPGCVASDLHVTQMLRERDCGPNSATTLKNAFESALTENPLITLTDGRMVFDLKRLTVQGLPIGVDYYNGSYIYAAKLEKDSLANRAWWTETLRSQRMISPLSIRSSEIDEDAPMSVEDEYHLDDQMLREFNYFELVETQDRQDARETNISAVQTMLLSQDSGQALVGGFITAFNKTLAFPSTAPLVRYIKQRVESKVELETLLSAHDGDISALAEDVLAIILREHIPAVIESGFLLFLSALPVSVSLREANLVDDFLERNRLLYNKLSLHQQRSVKEKLQPLAEHVVFAKLVAAHEEVANELLARHGRACAAGMQLQDCQDAKFTRDEICRTVDFLKAYAKNKFVAIIEDRKNTVIASVCAATIPAIIKVIENKYTTLAAVLTLFDENANIIPWQAEQMSMALSEAKTAKHALAPHEIDTALGAEVLAAINLEIKKHALQEIDKYMLICSRRFLNIAAQKLDIDVEVEGSDIPALINHYLSQDEMLAQLYQHPGFKAGVEACINEQILQLRREKLHAQYQRLANIVLTQSYTEFTFSNAAPLFAGSSVESVASALWETYTTNPTADVELNAEDFRADFYRWFSTAFISELQRRTQGINQFKQWLTALDSLLGQLQGDINAILGDKWLLTERQRIQDLTLQCSHFKVHGDLFEQEYAAYNAQVVNLINSLNKKTYRYYKPEDTNPAGVTVVLRSFYCALFNFNVPRVLSLREVKRIDRLIKRAIDDARTGIMSAVSTERRLIVLPSISQLPPTYNKPLSSALLIDCLGYLFSRSDTLRQQDSSVFINKIIDIVNSQAEISHDEIDEDTACLLKRLLDLYAGKDVFAMYTSSGAIEQIQAALRRTSTLGGWTPTMLNFADINRFLSLSEVAAQSNPLSQATLQQKTLERVRQIKAQNPNAEINLSVIRHAIMQETNSDNRRSASATTLDITNVRASELVRSGLSSWSIFGGGLTGVERTLLRIQAKHSHEVHFYLDNEDANFLRQQLTYHWQKMVAEKGAGAAFHQYAYQPTRNDKVYIALAELLAKQERQSGNKTSCFELLMPGQFVIRHYQLPEKIIEGLGIQDEDDVSIDLIPLHKAVFLNSGYVLNIDWVIHAYTKQRELLNFCTNELFSNDELEIILRHRDASSLYRQVSANCRSGITKAAIFCLRDYLNGAIFRSGFGGSYDGRENARAFDAYTEFNRRLLLLSPGQRRALLNEPIPGEESDTVGSMFTVSELRGSGKNARCLTLRGVSQAKVVLAYEPVDHGLTNSELFSRARSVPIPHRCYSTNQAREECSAGEAFILNFYDELNRTHNFQP